MSKKSKGYDDPGSDETQMHNDHDPVTADQRVSQDGPGDTRGASPDAPNQDPSKDLAPPDQRARELVTALTEAQKHNAPVTMWMLNELRDLFGHFTGKEIPKPLHAVTDSRGQPGNVTFRAADGTTLILDTIEELLAYVRSLPVETQKRPLWRAADKLLSEAVNYIHGADVSPAVRAFQSAIDADRSVEGRTVDIPPRDPSLDPPKPQPAPEQPAQPAEATHA